MLPRVSLRPLALASLLSVFAAAACAAPTSDDASVDSQAEALNENKALGMTDVTVLYPLPKNVDYLDDMLGPSSELDQGELLPAEVFAQLAPLPAPPMTDFQGKPLDTKKALFADWADSFSTLRVVGIRLDPCFGATSNLGATDCMNTIRLTAQFFTTSNGSVTVDGRSAIHLFYKVSRADFTAIAKGMLALRKSTGLPLQKGIMGTTRGVHPTLAAEGLRGAYASALKDLVLKYAGEQTLVQLAFCVQDRGVSNGYYDANQNADSRWVFGRFEHRAGTLYPLDIASLDYTGLQTVDSMPRGGVRDRDPVVVTPALRVKDDFLGVFNWKPEPNGTVDQTKIEAARKGSYSLQNPNKYTARTADCVSCHMAKQAGPNHGADPLDFKSYTYRLDHTPDAIGAFRMFGYDGNGQPIVARRVVNETVVVLDYLNKVVMK